MIRCLILLALLFSLGGCSKKYILLEADPGAGSTDCSFEVESSMPFPNLMDYEGVGFTGGVVASRAEPKPLLAEVLKTSVCSKLPERDKQIRRVFEVTDFKCRSSWASLTQMWFVIDLRGRLKSSDRMIEINSSKAIESSAATWFEGCGQAANPAIRGLVDKLVRSSADQ
jgi:hypothetical protein